MEEKTDRGNGDQEERQQGSLVSDEYLRFDFTYPKALTDEQTANVEKLIRDKIEEDCLVRCEEMDI